MTIAEMVRRLLDVGANNEAIQIAIQAIEEERDKDEEAKPRAGRPRARKPEIVAQRA